MPSVSKAQQQAAAIALHAPKSELRGASRQMAKSMSGEELHKFAATRRKGLPKHVESASDEIVRRLLEDEEMYSGEERKEVQLANTILSGLRRLQSSLPDPTPEQQHALTGIRAAANELVRMHHG